MYENYEQEIDLKWLLYRVLRSWRMIAAWAIIIGLILGIWKLATGFVNMSDEEFMAETQTNYERAYASWLAEGENLEASLENLAEEKARQAEYNEKSVKMEIDPLRVSTASFELYVDYDYQILPNMTYQNVDMSDRILKSYATYMTNGEMEQYILNNLSYEMDLRYLKEILSKAVDYSNNVITVSVIHVDAEKCQEMLELAKAAILSRYEIVCDNIADHEILDTNASAYEYVDFNLEDVQKANKKYLTELDVELQEVNEEYLEWRKSTKPEFEYSSLEVVKSSIKMLIIGGVVAAMLVVIGIACACLFSGKLLNPEDIRNRYGVRVIGMLPTDRVKKPFAFVSRWFAKFGGITVKPEDYDAIAKMIGSSIKQSMNVAESVMGKKVVLTGTVAEEELKRVANAIPTDGAYAVEYTSNVLVNAEAIEKVADADAVVLVEKQESSLHADVAKELETLKAWNKTVLGAIVLNVDAVM